MARLPIKLASGQIQQTGVREGSIESDEDMEDEVDTHPLKLPKPTKRDFAGARFGRASVADVIRIESRPERIQSAKEQIAAVCQDILSEPENGVSNPPQVNNTSIDLLSLVRPSSTTSSFRQ